MSRLFDLSLIARVRRAELSFEQLVQLLSTRGYITTLDGFEGASFTKPSMDQTRQEDFDALFALLMPGQLNDIKLRTHATCKGAAPGLYTTVLFNVNVIDYETMDAQLIEINRGEL